MKVFEYRLKWLRLNKHNQIADYLEANRVNIKEEFESFANKLINEKLEEIEKIKRATKSS